MKNSQKGFTLIEILVAMGVSGILLSGLVVSISQTFGVTRQSNAQIVAMENMTDAAYRISKDVRSASTSNLVSEYPVVYGNLTLNWTQYFDGSGNLLAVPENHSCSYVLSQGKLNRSYDGAAAKTVAQYIDSIQFSQQVSLQGKIISVTVTSYGGDSTQTPQQITYQMYLKPKENPVR